MSSVGWAKIKPGSPLTTLKMEQGERGARGGNVNWKTRRGKKQTKGRYQSN